MADAVPVCDALFEAIEYLSRLGSNIQVRSENFKQKKIRKDKLQNTHAVQKAANKLLLICELSKKSILNVEDGVKQILSQIDLAQGSNKFTKNVHISKENIVYEYFEHDSQTLKIRNKINLKHYTSVKVVAKAMPLSLQNKYPLYYVCNLYHLRERRDKQKCDHHELTEIEILNNSNDEDPAHVSSINSSQKSDANINNCEVANKLNNIQKSDSKPKNIKDHVEKTEIKKKFPVTKNKKYKHIKVVDDDSSDSNYNGDNLQSNENIVPINNAANRSVEASSTNKKNNTEEENTQESNNVADTSADEPAYVTREENTSKFSSARNTEENKKNAEDASIDKEIGRIEKMDTDMIVTNKIDKEDQNSSHSEKDTNNSIIEFSNSNTHAEKCANTSLLNDLCTVSTDVSNTDIAIESKSEAKSISDDNSRCSTESKPLIKCVNINKLLKIDKIPKTRDSVIEIIDSDTDHEMTVKNKQHTRRHNKNNKKYQSKSKSKLSLIKCTKDSKIHKSSNPHISDDEDFWKKKRKEVKKFKPKQFTVNIIRMPKLTEQFLYKYDLKIIIQNGTVVCEIPLENGGTGLKQYKSNAQRTVDLQNSKNKIKEGNVVKSTLLNDSESDCEKETGKCNEIKKTLLNESDTLEQHEKAKSKESADDKNCEKDNQRRKTTSEQESQNTNDSSDINTKSRKRKRKSRNSTSLLAAKRNCIMKSVHAKNMLLNCSSSSDTEDEEVKNVLKNIKDSLLKRESDEDIEMKQKSGSDGEVTKSNQECDISTKDANNQEHTEVNSDSNSEIFRNNIKNIENIEKAKSDGSEDDKNSEKNIDNDKQRSETPSEQESDHNNDSSKSPVLSKQRRIKKRENNAKKKLLNCSSSSDTEDEGVRDALRNIKDSLLKGESDEDIEKNSGSDGKATKSNTSLRSQGRSDSDFDISTKGTSSQGNEVDTNSSSEKIGRSKSKPDGSSSQSADTQDSYEKDIDGLTNLNTLTKRRRRRRSTSYHSQSTSSNSVSKMPKAPLISEEGFLKAESSSDAASLADSDVGEEVEIPAVSMSGLNGDSIDHLAKADLLEESITSDSHEKSSDDIKKEEESEEDNVKSKRRKTNAISSESEAGGSRRKNRGVKLSDFEDSEDDSEPNKKSKRKKKKKNNDSDASVSSSIDGSKKKRRRIKHIDDSDDASGSESETEGRNKHGRKNIRKVMGKNQLEEATKKAAREEKERIARIAERQKLYNNLQFDESGKPDEVVLDKVVLDFDPETKEPLIEVDKGLVKKLKPHQANGIKFMWDACFESVKRIKKDKGSGCILAHCMGLGKTLQVVSLTHTLLTHGELTGVRRVLVVCPLSTVLNWVNEFGIWLKHSHADYDVDVYELSRHKQNSERAWQLQQWFSGGGVCVLGYEMFRNLSADNSKKFKKKMLKSFQESLVDPGPDLVVCDEGHLLKNEKTSLSQAMNRVKTLRRIVLTGTPLQNNLKEYYCMVQFVKPNLLGKYNEYLNRFVNPITNGQYTDSTEHDIRVMKRRSHVLHKMLDGAVQRRDYGVLAPFLPPKHEYVLFITLSEVQIKLYEHYLDNYSRRPLPGKSSGFLFPDFQSLQRIWTHPLVLKYNSERYEIMQQKKREREEEDSEGSIADFIDDDSTPDESSTEESTDSLSDMSDDSRKKNKKKKSTKKSKGKDNKMTTRRGTRANPIEVDDDDVILEEEVQIKSENPTEWWMSLVTEDELDDLRHSHKLVLLFDILRQCETIGDKLLVFSQSLYSLDLIEHFLGKVDEATQEARVDEKLNGHVGSWSQGVDYFRLDGSTSCENRSIWCKNFNREDNPRARLFLISTRAGGLGINLVAANRVVIFDVSWNPSHDVQSIFRVYRFGQKKPCYIYRFLAMGTMEEKIYERQVTKQAISKRVIDEQQIDRHYAENDLAELYKFEPRPPAPRELPPLPKDRLFAEMLREHEAQIYKYHEHDSLLENKEEETLTEEERKAAWEDFENEKTRPPPAPFSAYMHNGMMPGLLQQQQQLAYATFAALLHKEMPNASDAQIREALYRSNPAMFGGYDYGLLQKMGELYKYAQPGMMNPAMMNPAMNAAGGMALGGSSGLQYEPPWQRQQQMRMQQLLQQNQQMGAKFYAGGLGSRDPVAMALQQQRAREMMLGERGRARGRPRHDAVPPVPIAPSDVVNLDSD